MKNVTLALALGTAVTTTALGFGVNSASALTFNFNFDIDYPSAANPTPVTSRLITEDFLTTDSGFTGYRVISITGTQGTDPFDEPETGPIITLNAPGTTQIGPFAALNDNLFNPSGSEFPTDPASAFFSQGGLAYTINENNTTPPTVDPYQAFYDAASQTYMGCLTPCVTLSNLKVVPEPSSTAGLLAIGSFGALGAASTLKRKLKSSKSDEN